MFSGDILLLFMKQKKKRGRGWLFVFDILDKI